MSINKFKFKFKFKYNEVFPNRALKPLSVVNCVFKLCKIMRTNQSTMANISVLFMCDGQNIASECEQVLTIQSLQNFDNSWDD